MLLKFRQLMMMKSYDQETKQFEAREDLTADEKQELLKLDNWHYEIDKKHIISNYEILKNN